MLRYSANRQETICEMPKNSRRGSRYGSGSLIQESKRGCDATALSTLSSRRPGTGVSNNCAYIARKLNMNIWDRSARGLRRTERS